MRATVVDCGSTKVGDIAHQLTRCAVDVEVVPLNEVSRSGEGDFVVISGGPHLFTANANLIEAFSFLDHVDVPVLGICLGHQALGIRDGARVFLGASRRMPEAIDVVNDHELWRGLGTLPTFGEDHCEGIDLPPDWTLLASSQHYPVEAMVHASLPRIGVQFHPEISGENGQRLFENFVSFARRVRPE